MSTRNGSTTRRWLLTVATAATLLTACAGCASGTGDEQAPLTAPPALTAAAAHATPRSTPTAPASRSTAPPPATTAPPTPTLPASSTPLVPVMPTTAPARLPGIGQVSQPLAGAVQKYLAGTHPQDFTIAVYDLRTGRTLTYKPGRTNDTASIVKLDILQALMAQTRDAGRPLSSWEKSHAVPMIEHSSDDDATALWGAVSGGSGLAKYNAIGPRLTATTPGANGWWGWTRTTAEDQLRLVSMIAQPNATLTDSQRAYAISLLTRVEHDQQWGLPAGAAPHSWVKVGWMLQNSFGWNGVPRDKSAGWTINSIGHVTGPGRNYLAAILTKNSPTEKAGIDVVNKIGQLIWARMG